MQTTQPAYFTAYSSLNMNRDARGVLVVEFHTNDAGLGSASLRALPGVTSVRESPEGDATRWTLTALEPHVTLPALFALAERAAARVAHLSMRSATLEDVFVSLTGRALRD